jgi:hypothetical protein
LLILTIFCRPFQPLKCAIGEVGARSIAGSLKNTVTVHKLRLAGTPYLQGSSNTFSRLGFSLHLQTLVDFSPALSHAATRTQWPVPQACFRGMPNSSTSHVPPSRGHHAPCCPRRTNILPLALHRAPCTVHRYRSLLTVRPSWLDVPVVVYL